MQQKIQLIFSLLLLSNFAFAQQHPTCDGERYIDPVFDDLTLTENLKYGENTTIGGSFQELFLDVFEPEGDDAEARPLIILAHGGSFIFGERSDVDFLCEDFAQRGFVTATIDYRLLDAFVFDSIKIVEEVLMAVSDMKAAIRYFREDAATDNVFKIDTNLIFAGGISAGGIIANHVGYVDPEDDIQTEILDVLNDMGGFQGNSSTNTQYSSSISGILNYAGALKEAKWVDENDPPVFSAHDDGDGVVPYGNGFSSAIPIGNYLEGSASIKAFADVAGLSNGLITVENSDGHVSFFGNNAATYQDSVIQSSSVFLEEIICGMVSNAEEIALADSPRLKVFPNPASTQVTLEFDNLNGAFDLSIVNISGQIIFEKRALNKDRLSINVQQLEAGIYFVNVIGENKAAIWQKLIIE